MSLEDKNGTDPFRWAAIRSGWVMKHQNVTLAGVLLDEGAAVDARDKDGFTPQIWAANRGAVRLVEFLIARGADVNARTTQQDNAGRSGLYMAGSVGVVRVPLAAGADPRALTEDGGPPPGSNRPRGGQAAEGGGGEVAPHRDQPG